MLNDFLSRLEQVDSNSVETVVRFNYSQDFKKETGIHHNRMANIVKSNGEDVTLEEMKQIVEYYRKKTGKEIKLEDLFSIE